MPQIKPTKPITAFKSPPPIRSIILSGTTHKPVIGRFEHEENGNVRMRDFKGRKGTSDDKKDVTVEELLPYGINALDTEFEVVKANGKELILKSDYATLMLKRF